MHSVARGMFMTISPLEFLLLNGFLVKFGAYDREKLNYYMGLVSSDKLFGHQIRCGFDLQYFWQH